MKRFALLFLLLTFCGSAQIYRNNRGAWNGGTLYTVGDYWTCSGTTYLTTTTFVSASSNCLQTSTGANIFGGPGLYTYAQVVGANTGIGFWDDNTLGGSLFPKLNGTLFWLADHLTDKLAYNDWLQISTPGSAPASGYLRVYGKSNAICWIPPGGTEQCAGSSTLGGDVTGSSGSNTVVGIQGKPVANTTPTNGQALIFNAGANQYQPGIPSSSSPAGSPYQYQRNSNSGGAFAAASMSDDANGRPTAAEAINEPAYTVTFSATPTYDLMNGKRLEITMTGNITSSSWAHLKPGDDFYVVLIQDGTGSHTNVWPAGTVSACAPWPVANSITTVHLGVSVGGTVIAEDCPVYDPANPGVVFSGLLRAGLPPNAASGQLNCGFVASSYNTWVCVDASGNISSAIKGIANPSDSQYVTYIGTDGVQHRAQPASTGLSDSAALKRVSDATEKVTLTVGTGGVTANTPVKYSGTTGSPVIATTSTEGMLGIAESTVSASGSVVVDLIGPSHCIASGSITANDYVSVSGGTCVDTLQTARSSIASTVNLVGRSDASYTNGQTVGVGLIHPYATGAASGTTYTAGSNVQLNGTAIVWNQTDPTQSGFWEDFLQQTTSTLYGATAPHFWTNGSGATFTLALGSVSATNPQNHPGTVKITYSATANPWGTFSPYDYGVTFSNFTPSNMQWDLQEIVNLNFVTNNRYVFGWLSSSTFDTNNRIDIRYDGASDTYWTAEIYSGGTGHATTVVSSTVPTTGWHTILLQYRLVGVSSNPTLYAFVDGVQIADFCSSGCNAALTDFPGASTSMWPGTQLAYNGTPSGSPYAEIDAIGMRFIGLPALRN